MLGLRTGTVRKGHCWVAYGPTGLPLWTTDAKTVARAIREYADGIERGSNECVQWPPIVRERDTNIGVDIPVTWRRSDLPMEPGPPVLTPERGEIQLK